MMPRPLDPLFSPRAVAVVGASRDRGSIGFAILHNLVVNEFQGAIFPVNPKAAAVHSLKCYPRVGDIPDPVDLAVIAVPGDAVEGVVEECLAKGIRGLVVISAGFGETGGDGAEVERRLREKVRGAGARMIGPNCMGVINADPEVRLDATFAPVSARPGAIGFLSQSGALGVAILNTAAELGLGLSQFASLGNKADVSGNDLLEHWEDALDTRVIAMYLESFGNPRRFTEIAKRVGRKKPILVVKSGRTEQGARAATSHTGAIAAADVTVSAFLEQCGVLRADTIDELFDVARAFDRCPLPAGNRLAILTNAGGPAIMATDACVALGLEMAELAAATRKTLAAFLPREASLANPVDMIASATGEQYGRGLAALLADPGVDMVMAINVTPLLTDPREVMDEVTAAARGSEKPVLAVMMATEEFYDRVKRAGEAPPVYRFPESAARALARLWRYAAWRRRPVTEAIPEFAVDDDAVEELLGAQEGNLPPDAAFRILEGYGIPVARWRLVARRREVVEAARAIGYPVVVKAVAPELIHKSELSAVKVDLRDRGELEEALDELDAALAGAGIALAGYLVQEMAREGHEVIFGISTDPRFGPLLMFGLGGKYVEVFRDVRFGVLPLAPPEAMEMVRGIRGFRLLTGVRGEEGADLELLEEILLRIAQLAQRHPRIRELDVNPFLAAADRERSKAVDVRIAVGPPGAGAPAGRAGGTAAVAAAGREEA